MYHFLKYGALAYLLTFLATCELLPFPTHSFCSRDHSLINSYEVLRRILAKDTIGQRRSLFPGVPEQTPEEVYSANPGAWQIRRALLGYASAWEVTVKERVTNVDRPGTWEGTFSANLCADKIEAAWIVTYDDERQKIGEQRHK